MKHEDIPPVPFTAWIQSFNGTEVQEVCVTEYGLAPGAILPTVVIEGDGRPYRASVDFIYATEHEVKAKIGAGLRETVKNYRKTIEDLQSGITEHLGHPYYYCS